MQKWEYLTAVFKWEENQWILNMIDDGLVAIEQGRTVRTTIFRELGSEGWELVNYSTSHGNNFGTAIFKRPRA